MRHLRSTKVEVMKVVAETVAVATEAAMLAQVEEKVAEVSWRFQTK